MISVVCDKNGGKWVFSPEEIVKVQNRMNDLWETDPNDIDEYIAVANRLLGTLDAYMTFEHFITIDECSKCGGHCHE